MTSLASDASALTSRVARSTGASTDTTRSTSDHWCGVGSVMSFSAAYRINGFFWPLARDALHRLHEMRALFTELRVKHCHTGLLHGVAIVLSSASAQQLAVAF